MRRRDLLVGSHEPIRALERVRYLRLYELRLAHLEYLLSLLDLRSGRHYKIAASPPVGKNRWQLTGRSAGCCDGFERLRRPRRQRML